MAGGSAIVFYAAFGGKLVRAMRQTQSDSLFGELGVTADGREEASRTERTSDTETVVCDRLPNDMYGELSVFASGSTDPGRTEETRTIETIDRDRVQSHAPWSLICAPADFYEALGRRLSDRGIDQGRTELTESTETIDWDRPPEH